MLSKADYSYKELLLKILTKGKQHTCRGHKTLELLNVSTTIDMTAPLILNKDRALGYRFCCAEAAWVMSGDNRVSTIKPYAKMIENFSDDGQYYFGAYGPKLVDQLPYIIKCFKKDIYTRQAVIQIWRERPYITKDVPCTLSIQFIYRDGYLHCIDNMRSSDAWLGIPYDWFTFSMISAGVAALLRNEVKDLNSIKLGKLFFNAGSQHLYLDKKSFGYDVQDVQRVIHCDENCFRIKPLDITTVPTYDHLMYLLKARADREFVFGNQWLHELWQKQTENKKDE